MEQACGENSIKQVGYEYSRGQGYTRFCSMTLRWICTATVAQTLADLVSMPDVFREPMGISRSPQTFDTDGMLARIKLRGTLTFRLDPVRPVYSLDAKLQWISYTRPQNFVGFPPWFSGTLRAM